MGFSPDLSITGPTTITGLTNPTYTWVSDFAPDNSSRQWAVSALGGTQTNVRTHTNGDPFTFTIRKSPYRGLGAKNPVTGAYGTVPKNKIECLTRKGVYIDSAGVVQVVNIRTIAEIPAGAEQADAINIKAAIANHHGVLTEEINDYVDTLITGLIS